MSTWLAEMSDVDPPASGSQEQPGGDNNSSNRIGRRFLSILIALSLIVLVQLHAEKVGMTDNFLLSTNVPVNANQLPNGRPASGTSSSNVECSKYIMLSSQRSNSTWLCQVLNHLL